MHSYIVLLGEAEYLEHNRRVERMLKEKGFGVAGDESLGVRVNRHLRLGGTAAD